MPLAARGRFKIARHARDSCPAGLCRSGRGACLVGAGHCLSDGLLCSRRRGVEQHVPSQEGRGRASASGHSCSGSPGREAAGGGSRGRCSGGRSPPLTPDLQFALNCSSDCLASAVRDPAERSRPMQTGRRGRVAARHSKLKLPIGSAPSQHRNSPRAAGSACADPCLLRLALVRCSWHRRGAGG